MYVSPVLNLQVCLSYRNLWAAFTQRFPSFHVQTPQQRYDAAVNDRDYSDEACLKSWALKTVVLTGTEAGEEKVVAARGEADRQEEATVQNLVKTLLSAILARIRGLAHRMGQEGEKAKGKEATKRDEIYRDRLGGQPPFAKVGITWAEPGLWKGRQAYILRLHIEHHRGLHHYLFRVELDVRFWRAGDAAKSQAEVSHLPLDPSHQPTALELAAEAPEIVFYGPRAAVGRPANTPVDCFWDGHFQPGANWCYFADVRTPTDLVPARPKEDEPRSVLCVYSYGDDDLKIPAPHFMVGMVVLTDGKPFDMTVLSSTFYFGCDPVPQYLWSPYKPGKFNGTAHLIPDGEKPMGPNLESEENKARWENLVDWSKPYDTVSSFAWKVQF